MHRKLLVILALVGFAGCAKAPSPEAVAWYDTQTRGWVNAVINSCQATHSNFETDLSPVDCMFANDLSMLVMTFPTREFYERAAAGVAEYLFTWCNSVRAHTGRHSNLRIILRHEHDTGTMDCAQFVEGYRPLLNDNGP